MTTHTNTTTGIDLDPCPFCGSSRVSMHNSEYGLDMAMCDDCSAEGPAVAGENAKKHAAELWNRRAEQTATGTGDTGKACICYKAVYCPFCYKAGTGDERPSDVHDFGSMIDPNASRNIRPRAKAGTGDADERCATCDGTGDVHRADGEWLGECACEAGIKIAFEHLKIAAMNTQRENQDLRAALAKQTATMVPSSMGVPDATTPVVDAGAQAAVQPAAAQFKAPGETWEECSTDEGDAMRARGYKFRYLYTTPPAAQTDDARDAGKAWEQYRVEQSRILGMPGLAARPCFIAGFDAALTAPDNKGTAGQDGAE